MPEGPELRLAAQFVNAVGARFTFGGPVVKSDLATKHQEVHFTSKAYTVSAQSRGKEIKVFLKPGVHINSSKRFTSTMYVCPHQTKDVVQ